MVTTFTVTYKPSLVRIDARNFELSWYQTHPHTHKETDRQDRLQYIVPQLARSVIRRVRSNTTKGAESDK